MHRDPADDYAARGRMTMTLLTFSALSLEDRALVAPSIGFAYERTPSGLWRMRLLTAAERSAVPRA